MFTAQEKKAIIFFCSLLLLGGLLRLKVNNLNDLVTQEQPDLVEININSASLEELTRIPSVGIKTAQKIVDYRNQVGVFKSLEDLKAVTSVKNFEFSKSEELNIEF